MSLLRKRGEIGLLLLSIALFLATAEAAVRLLGADQPGPTGYAPLNTNRRAMRPQNARGYRDLERAIPKPAGVRRIVNLGDSFAWGASVEFEDAYPQRLERSLSRRRREHWEVVNLALPGMNTVDEAAQLVDEGLAYEPEAVILGYVLNDSEDATSAETRRAEDWLAERRTPPGGFLNHSAVFRLVRGRLWATAENRRRASGYKSMFDDHAPGWIASRQALKTLGAACRERGIPLVVAIFPLFGNPLDERYPFPEIHARVAAVAADAGAKVIDLLPAYRGLKWEILVVDGADDEHPNEIAHRIAAGVLLKALDGILPLTAGRPAGEEPPTEPPPAPPEHRLPHR